MRNAVKYLWSALLLATVPAASAAAQGVTLGVKAGANVADVSIRDQGVDLDTGTRTGFVAGGVLSFTVHPAFAIQPEVLFSQKGAKADADGVTATLKANYLEVPILLKVMVPNPSMVRPVFYAGPAVAFETSCSLAGEVGGISVDVDCDAGGVGIDVLERKKTDFGIVGGAGLDVDLGQIVLTFEGRYNLGLVNLDDSGLADTSAKARTFSALAGVAFKLPT